MDEQRRDVRRRDALTVGLLAVAGLHTPTRVSGGYGLPDDVTCWAHDLLTNRTVDVAGRSPRPLLSLFGGLVAARILRDQPETLRELVTYTGPQLERGSPVTAWHVRDGLTVEELCRAAVHHSDVTAANLLLSRVGGPSGCTAFCRSLGDRVTRVDRWAPACTAGRPWDERDTTTAVALARTYGQVVLGDALPPADRRRFSSWLAVSRLPARWDFAHLVGSGRYGSCTTVGVATRGPRRILVAASVRGGQPGSIGTREAVLAVVASTVERLDRRR